MFKHRRGWIQKRGGGSNWHYFYGHLSLCRKWALSASEMQSLTASSHGDIASCPHCRLLYIANIESELAEALKDTQRLDYLIRQWPPGAAESLGLNEEIWDAATGH